MKVSKCLVTKLFCIIASIMCVSKAEASELINTENMDKITSLSLDNQTLSDKGFDVAWRFCCGLGSSSDENPPTSVSTGGSHNALSSVS